MTTQQKQMVGVAVASLVLGIAGMILIGPLGSIPAVICGHIAKSRIKKNPDVLTGGGMALAGLILGYVQIGFIVIIIPLLVIPMVLPAIQGATTKANATSTGNNGSQVWKALYSDNLERDQNGDATIWPEKNGKIDVGIDGNEDMQSYATSTEYFKICSQAGAFSGISPSILSASGIGSATAWSKETDRVEFDAKYNAWCVVVPDSSSYFSPETPLFFTRNFTGGKTIDTITGLLKGEKPFGNKLGIVITYGGSVKIITDKLAKKDLQGYFNPLNDDFEFLKPSNSN